MKKKSNNNFLSVIGLLIMTINCILIIIYVIDVKKDRKNYFKTIHEKDSIIYQRDSSLFVWKDSYERVKKTFTLDTAKINRTIKNQ